MEFKTAEQIRREKNQVLKEARKAEDAKAKAAEAATKKYAKMEREFHRREDRKKPKIFVKNPTPIVSPLLKEAQEKQAKAKQVWDPATKQWVKKEE